MFWLALLALLFPLTGFLILGIGFRKIPSRIASWIGPGTIGISFLLAIVVFSCWQSAAGSVQESTGNHSSQVIASASKQATWFSSGDLSVTFGFLIDPLSLLMLLIVTGIGFIIHVYSVGYMRGDPGYNRFFAYMNLFVFFMLVLVLADNYLVMFIGWEGVGLCSYLLIGFWFRNQKFNNAAKKAFIMNRIGDLGFLLGIFLIYTTFGSLCFSGVFPKARLFPSGDGTIIAITLLLFIGAIGKSAQIPLHTWLPDAMAGPTPVSALIHAATMVAAGVYMVARSGVLYMLAPQVMTVVATTGLITALVAGSVAIYQPDIKKVLAWSTISQLGLMFLGLGLGAFTGAMFHLTTHAFFKALLFLAAGSVIHVLGGEQDIRKMGGLKEKLPKTWFAFLIGTIAIAGIPPFSGFFSKDEILLHAFSSNLYWWLFAFTASLMTAIYMFRLLYLVFYSRYREAEDHFRHVHESPRIMTIPVLILAFLSAAGGVLNVPALLGGKALLGRFLEPAFAGIPAHAGQTVPPDAITEWLLIIVTVTALLISFFFVYRHFVSEGKGIVPDSVKRPFFPALISAKYYIDELYRKAFVDPILTFSGWLDRIPEKKWIDGAVNGIGKLAVWSGATLRYIQTGHVGFYLFMMIFGILVILVFNILIR